MTLVVGLAHGGRVYMGTDSAEAGVDNLSVRRDPQIVWKGAFFFGVPSSYRLENLVRYSLDMPDSALGPDLRRFLVDQVAAPLRTWIAEGQFAPVVRAKAKGAGDPDFREFDALMLVGHQGRLFTVGADGQVVEPLEGYDALGTGDEAALGALRVSRGQRPDLRAFAALHAAEYLTGAVRAPFHVWSLDQHGECDKCADRWNAPVSYRQDADPYA
jgi:hypothetical protein